MKILQSGTPVAFLYVKDRERALKFYRESLGFELQSSDEFGDFIDLGSGLARMTVMPDYVATPHPALGWNVGDINAAVKALRDRGVTFNIQDRKSTRLNSSHSQISYAVFCLKKKKKQ